MTRTWRGLILPAGMASGASGQQFANGNFAGNANGWTFTDCDFGGGYKNGIGSDGTNGFAFLNNAGQASTFPRVSQTVSGFTTGRTYRVSGFLHTGVFFYTGDVFQALIDSAVVFNGPNMLLGQWTPFSYTFAATATSHLFSFRAEVTSDSDWNLDTLSISSASTISGHAYLDGYTAAVTGQPLEVQVWQGGSVVQTLSVSYGTSNAFSFSSALSGPAILKFRFRTGLWKAIPVTLGGTAIENLVVNMANGDIDHDNAVTVFDYAVLSDYFDLSSGDSKWSTVGSNGFAPRDADLDGDFTVSVFDYALLSDSFDMSGD